MNNEQDYVEVVPTVNDAELHERIETMAAEMGISPKELIIYAVQEHLKCRSLEVTA